jgi:small subunit ribosomal protein S3
MGHKISPISMRLGINRDWESRWFGGAKYTDYLKEDLKVRTLLDKKLKNMGVDKIAIFMDPNIMNIVITTARPGLIIGRGGTGIEDLKKLIHKTLRRKKTNIRIEIQELKNPDASATVVGDFIADQLEKRIPFRRLMKQSLGKIMANKEVKGAKIQIGGRLDGAEIARSEHLEEGSLPLQTLRANIDYARSTAHTTYGTIGIKVWIYKGEVFEKKDNDNN